MADGTLMSLLGSDATVIVESARRPEAFSVIFDRHFDAIYGYLARRAGGDVADDLASLTFTVAFEQRARFIDGTPSARPWLYGIATNLLHDRRRSDRRADATTAALEADGGARCAADRPADADSALDDPLLATALRDLDSSYRDVLLLFAWGELSYEEIATALDVPLGTVRSRLSRAREQLKAALTEPDSVPATGQDLHDEQEHP